MHKYMQAIGMGAYENKKQIKDLFDRFAMNVHKIDSFVDNGEKHVEMSIETGKDMGIAMQGIELDNGNFQIEYYYPYCKCKTDGEEEEVSLEREVDRDVYVGVCDDIRVGVSMVFHVQNSFELRRKNESDVSVPSRRNIEFVGMSTEGKILFPVNKSEKEIRKKQMALLKRNKLIFAARQGDAKAMESLTMEDLDTYNTISRRIQEEDLFSIVDSCFMPYGILCDRYMVIGTIIDIETVKNNVTDEDVCKMVIVCNDVALTIVINRNDLLGEPIPGRRFKGVIWLQGKIS